MVPKTQIHQQAVEQEVEQPDYSGVLKWDASIRNDGLSHYDIMPVTHRPLEGDTG